MKLHFWASQVTIWWTEPSTLSLFPPGLWIDIYGLSCIVIELKIFLWENKCPRRWSLKIPFCFIISFIDYRNNNWSSEALTSKIVAIRKCCPLVLHLSMSPFAPWSIWNNYIGPTSTVLFVTSLYLSIQERRRLS